MSGEGTPRDPRFLAAVDLIGRTGASGFQMRYQDDEQPMVWIAVATYDGGETRAGECGAALNPLKAVMRLLDELIDGGTCAHCRRPSGVTEDWRHEMPLSDRVCWYVYDPELQKFRRSCEGETT